MNVKNIIITIIIVLISVAATLYFTKDKVSSPVNDATQTNQQNYTG